MFSKVKDLFRSEPAALIGAAASAVAVVAEAVGDAPSWKAAVPALLGLLIRYFVSPAVRA